MLTDGVTAVVTVGATLFELAVVEVTHPPLTVITASTELPLVHEFCV